MPLIKMYPSFYRTGDCKVVPGERAARQHPIVVCQMTVGIKCVRAETMIKW